MDSADVPSTGGGADAHAVAGPPSCPARSRFPRQFVGRLIRFLEKFVLQQLKNRSVALDCTFSSSSSKEL